MHPPEDYDGAVPGSKVSGECEDGDDYFALPDSLSPSGVRDRIFDYHSTVHREVMLGRRERKKGCWKLTGLKRMSDGCL